jgi:hypothetical protein
MMIFAFLAPYHLFSTEQISCASSHSRVHLLISILLTSRFYGAEYYNGTELISCHQLQAACRAVGRKERAALIMTMMHSKNAVGVRIALTDTRVKRLDIEQRGDLRVGINWNELGISNSIDVNG